MIVAACTDGSGKHGSTSIHSLLNTCPIAASRHFFDQDWCQSFRAELLVYAEEVDLCNLDLLATDGDRCRDAADGRDEFAGFGRAHSDVPIFDPTWRFQRPWKVSTS